MKLSLSDCPIVRKITANPSNLGSSMDDKSTCLHIVSGKTVAIIDKRSKGFNRKRDLFIT